MLHLFGAQTTKLFRALLRYRQKRDQNEYGLQDSSHGHQAQGDTRTVMQKQALYVHFMSHHDDKPLDLEVRCLVNVCRSGSQDLALAPGSFSSWGTSALVVQVTLITLLEGLQSMMANTAKTPIETIITDIYT